MVAVTAAVCVAAPGQPALPAWRLADGPVVPWTHETDFAARTVDPSQVAADNQTSWGLPGYEFLPETHPGMDEPGGNHWWGDYRGAEIEHDQSHARARLHAPGHRPLLGLLAHWIDRLFHPLRSTHRAANCDTSPAMQYSVHESMPGEMWAGEQQGPAASPFPQPLEPGLIPAAPLPEPLDEPTPATVPTPASELPVPSPAVEPAPTPIEPRTPEPTLPEPHLPEPAVPSNSLPEPSGLQPGLQPVQPQLVDPMPDPMTEPSSVEPAPSESTPNQAEPRELAPPTNVLPLERDTSADSPRPSIEPPPGRLGEEYPPVVELAPAPVLPDAPAQPETAPSLAPPPVLPAEPGLPRNTVPRGPRLPKNAIPRSSR
jgi:hypothetical protein